MERPGLTAALDYLRAGDTLVVCELDRRARGAGFPGPGVSLASAPSGVLNKVSVTPARGGLG
jgi:DNA invertase Pin-like site-specific DNA recombinase